MEEQIIKWIAQRIKDEHRKHAKNIDNWEQIAARKIVATYNVTLRQPAVISSLPNFEENLIGRNCSTCGHISCLCYKNLGIGNDL